jgi:hypothetical protein
MSTSTIQKNHEIIYGTRSSDVPVPTENVPKFIAVRNLSMCVISTSIFNFHLPDMSLQLNSTIPVAAGFRRCVNEICALLEFTQRRIAVLYRRFGRIYRSLEDGTDRLSRNVGNTTILRCVNSRTVKISWSHTAQTMVHCIHSHSVFLLSTVQCLIMQKWNTALQEPLHWPPSWQMWGGIHFSGLVRYSYPEPADYVMEKY